MESGGVLVASPCFASPAGRLVKQGRGGCVSCWQIYSYSATDAAMILRVFLLQRTRYEDFTCGAKVLAALFFQIINDRLLTGFSPLQTD